MACTAAATWSRSSRPSRPRLKTPHVSPHDLGYRQKRGHHRHDQPADDDADRDDGQWSDDPDDAVEAALQLGLIKVGDAARKRRQLAGLFAQSYHADRHARKGARFREPIRKLASVSNTFGGCRPAIGVTRA